MYSSRRIEEFKNNNYKTIDIFKKDEEMPRVIRVNDLKDVKEVENLLKEL